MVLFGTEGNMQMKHESLVVGIVVLAVFGAGCEDRTALDETPCPCDPGWVCDKSKGEPGVCVKKTGDGGSPEQTPLPQQDAARDDAPAAMDFVGTWKGYVENHTFDSGSDEVELVLSPGGQPGALSGYVVFGKGVPPPADPDVGFPQDGQWQSFLQEGFQFHLLDITVAGPRIKFEASQLEQWKEWCEAQPTTYLWNDTEYGCVPNWAFMGDGTDCYLFTDDQKLKIDCAKIELCGHWGVCDCDASACTASTIWPSMTFDMTRTNASLDGSVAGLYGGGGNLNVRLQKQ
jgi:hypothetical protein